MRVVLQRSKNAAVTVDGQTVGKISHGLVLLVGIADGDTEQDAAYIAEKVAGLRIFDDQAGRMNLSVLETGGRCFRFRNLPFTGTAAKDAARILWELRVPNTPSRCTTGLTICCGSGGFRWKRDALERGWTYRS